MSRLINPFCERCGRLSPRWMKLNRHHAGFWAVAACCCKKKKCPNLEVTLSGFNGSMCTGCLSVSFGADRAKKYTSVGSVDGTYSLEMVSETESACFYVVCVPASNVLTWDVYNNRDCDNVVGSGSSQAFQVEVNLRKSDKNITSCIIYAMDNSECTSRSTNYLSSFIQLMRETSLSVPLGDSIPNTANCAPARPIDGGFAIVDKA